MKNITVSVPDDVYRKARIRAAEQETSVSALVAAYLQELSNEESEFEKCKREMLEVIDEIKDFKVGKRIPRDKLYER